MVSLFLQLYINVFKSLILIIVSFFNSSCGTDATFIFFLSFSLFYFFYFFHFFFVFGSLHWLFHNNEELAFTAFQDTHTHILFSPMKYIEFFGWHAMNFLDVILFLNSLHHSKNTKVCCHFIARIIKHNVNLFWNSLKKLSLNEWNYLTVLSTLSFNEF